MRPLRWNNPQNQPLPYRINQKGNERAAIQKEIQDINKKREAFIAEEKIKKAKAGNNSQTLESEVERIIREQATRFNMKIQ